MPSIVCCLVVTWQGELLYEDDGTARPSDPPAQIASILALLLVRPPPRHATPRHASPTPRQPWACRLCRDLLCALSSLFLSRDPLGLPMCPARRRSRGPSTAASTTRSSRRSSPSSCRPRRATWRGRCAASCSSPGCPRRASPCRCVARAHACACAPPRERMRRDAHTQREMIIALASE